MLADPHRIRELGQPEVQPFQCCFFQGAEIGGHFLGLRIVPLPEFRYQLQ